MRSLRFVLVLGTICVCGGGLLLQAITQDSGAQEAARDMAIARPQVWVEATFIQIDTADLDAVKTSSGKTLDPQTGTVMLSGDEKAKLLAEMKKQPSFELIGSASLVTISGQEARMQMVEEVRYPTEYDAETAQKETADGKTVRLGPSVVLPRKFEGRDVGIRLAVTPTVSLDGTQLALVLLPEVSYPAGWVNFGSQTFTQPVFTSWTLTTTVVLRDGMTMVLLGVPTKNFEQSLLVNPQAGQKLKGSKSSVLLLSAKIIETDK